MATPGDKFIARSAVPGIGNVEIIYRFVQPGVFELPDSPMYDLTEDFMKYPAGTTLSRKTLEDLGFVLPNDAP